MSIIMNDCNCCPFIWIFWKYFWSATVVNSTLMAGSILCMYYNYSFMLNVHLFWVWVISPNGSVFFFKISPYQIEITLKVIKLRKGQNPTLHVSISQSFKLIKSPNFDAANIKYLTVEMFSVKLLIFSYSSFLTKVVGAQKYRLIETVLLSTQNICFGWEIRKTFFCHALLTKALWLTLEVLLL